MPCSDDPRMYPYPESDYRANQLARFLCEAMALVEADGRLHMMSTEAIEWWKAHQDADRRRVQREAREQDQVKARAQVMAQLTPYQKEVLGLF
jgi:hypothetical protein